LKYLIAETGRGRQLFVLLFHKSVPPVLKFDYFFTSSLKPVL
jgi:hypothetical protein